LRLALHPVILALKSSIFRYEGYIWAALLICFWLPSFAQVASEPIADSAHLSEYSKKTPNKRLDLNLADRAQLESLSGLGVKKVALILSEREQHGPFKSLEDLSKRVKGIGLKNLKRMREAGLYVVTVASE